MLGNHRFLPSMSTSVIKVLRSFPLIWHNKCIYCTKNSTNSGRVVTKHVAIRTEDRERNWRARRSIYSSSFIVVADDVKK